MRYLMKFATSADTQTALDNGTLGKPYVALISCATLDFNTLEVTPSYIGEWEDVCGDHTIYTFTVNDDNISSFENDVLIGTINCWYSLGSDIEYGDVDIYLNFDGWKWTFSYESKDETFSKSVVATYSQDGFAAEGLSIKEDESTGGSDWTLLNIKWLKDGYDTIFKFNDDGNEIPLDLTTINPTA